MIRANRTGGEGWMLRLFIGISPDAAAREALVAYACAQPFASAARTVPPERYHVTLAYLGERAADRLPTLTALLDGCAASFAPFPLSADRAAFFGRPENATVYAALHASEPLTGLCESLRTALTAAGETFDGKPLRPHITLARHASLLAPAPVMLTEDLGSVIRFQADGLTLYHSVRKDGELAYIPLYTALFSIFAGGAR